MHTAFPVRESLNGLQDQFPIGFHVVVVACCLLLISLLRLGLYFCVSRLRERLGEDHRAVRAATAGMRYVLRWLGVIAVLWLGIALLILRMAEEFNRTPPIAAKVVEASMVVLTAWLMTRLIKRLKFHAIRHKKRSSDDGYQDTGGVEALSLLGHVITYVLMAVGLLMVFRIPLSAITGLSIVGGFGTYGLVMANQVLISNLFSGLVLYFDRPFSVGDWVTTTDGHVDGVVLKIAPRLTTVLGPKCEPTYVPNSRFNSAVVVNTSRRRNGTIHQAIKLEMDDLKRVSKIRGDVVEYLSNHPAVDSSRPVFVHVADGDGEGLIYKEGCFGKSNVNLVIRVFTISTRFEKIQEIKDELMLGIGAIAFAKPEEKTDLWIPPSRNEGE